MKNFSDKVAVITGAGSGIGRYLALLLAKDGADVAICDIDELALNETAEMLRKYNSSVSVHLLDVSDSEAVESLPEKVIESHGKVNLVFNNAGVTAISEFKDLDKKDWDWVMNINLHGVVNSTRSFLPYLLDQPEAAIINTSSIFGMVAVPGQTVYHATKFAVRGFTESLALEMAQSNENVQIHCVHPGHIGTNIASNARIDEESFDAPNEERSIFTRNAPSNLQEMGDQFREGGMHPSKAAQIILKGVIKNKKRIFIGLDAKLLELSQRVFPNKYHRTWPFFMIPLMWLRDKKPLKLLD